MTRPHILIAAIILVAVICLAAGYWLAIPERKAIAPENGVGAAVISIRDTSSSQIYRVTGEYPQFDEASPDFNAAIANYVTKNLTQFESDSNANWQARLDTMPTGTKNTLPAQSFTFGASWTPEQINDRYLSIIVRLEYFNGGANETQLLKAFNYDVAAKKIMSLGDLFPNVPTYLQQISTLATQELTSSISDAAQEPLNTVSINMLKTGSAPTADNYSNFTFNDDVVTIYFSKYQVAAGVFGEQHVGIVRSTIQ